ncbi:MAG: class I SAM-dependent methyltransferase [Chloroflexota bacterium]
MKQLLTEQATWLAPARARLLRRVAIAHRQRLLDLGGGPGAVTPELVRRGGGPVVALDVDLGALQTAGNWQGATRVGGNGRFLPFAAHSFDLVFCQCVLMWIDELETAVAEIRRVLANDGVLIALEPDYGGMIEHPPALATQPLWLDALRRAGADPFVGRKLPGLLHAHGFDVRVSLFDTLTPPADGRFALLRSLNLTPAEEDQLQAIEANSGHIPWPIAHLPFFLIEARIS